MSSATKDLLQEHLVVRRIGNIAQTCSDKLYANEDIPIEDIQIISVVIEEFVDAFHHGKEEKAYFPTAKKKDSFAEDVRKFLIEHELGRRIANMLRRELDELIDTDKEDSNQHLRWNGKNKEPVARFLKSYAVFVSDHTGKEDVFFENILMKHKIHENEDRELLKHYQMCELEAGGEVRIGEMLRLIDYLEHREWMT
jgi:hemerythrin-like domain-containing protein